jgi:tetratricopeptide (TPR) repeat protein
MSPQISVAMMVKNEEDFLEDALLSAKPWVDELIVVDTGSTDRTVEIAQDLGATVSFFEWPNSFAIARNETLKQSNGDWVFILDADERIRGEDPQLLRSALKRGPHYPFQALLLNVINIAQDGRPLSSGFGPRVFPRHEKLGYAGRVHNELQSFDPAHSEIHANYFEGAEIIHLGYDSEIYRKRKKTERSLPLILASLEDNPENGAMHFYLGREYMRIQEFDKAAAACAVAIEVMNRNPQADNLLEGAWVSLINASRLAEHPFNEVMGLASTGLKAFPTNPDLWNAAAAVLLAAHKQDEAIKFLLQAKKNLAAGWNDAERSQGLALRIWELNERLALAYGELGQWKESYQAFLETIESRPSDIHGWEAVIDTTISLAERFEDTEQLERLTRLRHSESKSS